MRRNPHPITLTRRHGTSTFTIVSERTYSSSQGIRAFSARAIADFKANCESCALRSLRGRGQKGERESRQIPALQFPVPQPEIWKDLENGKKLSDIAAKNNVSLRNLRYRLRRIDRKRYDDIMRKRRRENNFPIPFPKIWRELEKQSTLVEIAKKHKINAGTLVTRLKREDKKRYERIMRRRRRSPFFPIPFNEIWNELRNGTPRNEIAKKYNIPRSTLSRRLRWNNEKLYNEIINRKKAAYQFPVPVSDVWNELEKGKTLWELGERYGVTVATIANRLKRADKKRYNDIIKHRPKGYLGSPVAKKKGVDSLLELRVMKLLEEHHVSFKLREVLVLEGGRCQPDFLLEGHVVIEVCGLRYPSYWKRYRKKARIYIKNGYTAYIIVPADLFKTAKSYLPKHRRIRIIALDEFKEYISEYARILKR